METNEEENIYYIDYECPNCFYKWTIEDPKQKENSEKEKLCDYCANHPNMNTIERLDRYFDIIEHTSVFRYPFMIKILWETIKSSLK